MEATRFLTVSKLLLAMVLTVLTAGAAMAQFTLPAPTADNEFGRLSWYTNVTNFGGNTSFGVFGQANTRNANGYGFGVFGYGGVNGTFGGAFLSQIIGTNANVGAWALGANATGGTGTYAGRVNIGMEVGSNNFAVSGLFGWAIRVDSGDVELGGTGGPLNTTYIHNLVVDGTVSGITGANHYTQNGTGNPVTTSADVNAVVVGEVQGTDTDPAIYGLNAGSGATFKGNVTGTGSLLELQNAGADVLTVDNAGDLSIGPGKFTVAAATGNTVNMGTLEQQGVIFSGLPTHTVSVSDSIAVSGQLSVGGTAFVAEKTGNTTIADVTTIGGASFNVSNSAGPTGTAMVVKSGNTTGFASTMTELTGAAQGTNFLNLVVAGGVPTAGGAAVGITHGLYVDSLRDDQYVDFTGATIKGMSGANDYTQTTAGNLVTTSSATTAAIVGNITDAANTDPTILLNNASTAGVVIQANQTSGATLMQLQNGGTTVFNVAGSGDLTIGNNQFDVTASNGKTTIQSNNLTGASEFNVTNSAGSTGTAMTITGGNTTGFSSTLTEPSNTAGQGTNFAAMVFTPVGSSTLTAGGAAVGVTHGMFVDSLRDNQYVDFTGATIKGISGANEYTQATTGGTVATSAATNASLIAQTGVGNTDTAFEAFAVNGPIMALQNGTSASPVTVFSVANGGNTTVTTTSGNTVTAVSTSSSTADYAIVASGNGATGANAIDINNGGVVVSGAAQPAGNTSTAIAAGFRTNTVTITNTLSQPTSYIVVTATGTGGDTYSATVVSQAAGTFNVKVTDVEGNVLADTPVTLSYWIVNH